LGVVDWRIDSNAAGAVEFMHGCLTASGSACTDRRSFTIVCRYDDELLGELARSLESAASRRSFYTFNSVPTTEWTIGSRYVYQQLIGESHYIIDDGSAKAAIGATDCTSHWHAMRIVREIYLREMLADAHTMMHAAAVEYAGKGLLLVGAKGHGKTTVSSRLMSDGWSFVANDRVLVGRRGGVVSAYPYPLDVRAHLTGVAAGVADRLTAVKAGRGDRRPDPPLLPGLTKSRFSVREWVEAHGATSRAWTDLSVVLLLRWVNTPRAMGLRRLSRVEAFGRLSASTFLGAGNVFSDDALGVRSLDSVDMTGPAVPGAWLHKVGPSSQQVLRTAIRSCRGLASDLPVYELFVGPRASSGERDALPSRLAELVGKEPGRR
jgi:hypothetical protein